jgi:hypothetical protein
MMNRNPIDVLFEMNNLDIRVTSETAEAHNPQASRWICSIARADAAGALLQVYSPFNTKYLYLPWSSILSIEPTPAP